MAAHTLRNIAVCVCMAEITGESCVLTRAGHHELVGTGVTGDTNFSLLALDADIQWLMRIVATKAVFNFVMVTAFMAAAALGDIVLHSRAMPYMTVPTIDLRLVRCTICLNLSWLLVVAFDTVIS